MRYTLVALTSLLSTLHALTITSPSSGSTVDPSQSFTIRWTLTAADPATFNLVFVHDGADQTLASNVQASQLSYTVGANTILTYGAGFTIAAVSSSGNTLASSGDFILNYGGATIVTNNGQLSLVTSGATATPSSISFDTSGVAGQSVTATYLSGSSSVTGATASSTDSTRPFTTHGIQSFSGTTLTGSSSSASSTSKSTTTSSSAASSSATASSSANAQPRNVVGKEAMSAVGLLAGLVALFA